MFRFVLGRAIQMLISLMAVLVIVFLMVRLTGDPLDVMLPAEATQEDYARMRSQLGLDKPLAVQYAIFVANALRGDFGSSLRFKRPSLEVVLERYPATLELGALAMLVSLLIALPIGVYAAVYRGGIFDGVGRGVAVLGQSLPNFWLGILLILVFGVWLRLLPTGGRGDFRYYILPAVTVGYFVVAGIVRLTRSSMLEVLRNEYITLARIKGLSEPIVIWKHAFKNAALPVLTFAVLIFLQILNGSIIVEMVFAWPGVGRLVVESVAYRDFPVVQTVVLCMSSMYIVANFGVDIAYAYLNPKLRRQ